MTRETNAQFALAQRDVLCLMCSTDQSHTAKYRIETVKEPVYPFIDPECNDAKHIREWNRRCDRKRNATEPGEYKIVPTENYTQFVSE